MYRETADRDRFFIHDIDTYRQIFHSYWKRGQFELLIARYRGTPIAAVTLVHLGRCVWYLYGASADRHRDVMAPHLLQWNAIKWAKDRGAAIYDFRGVPDVSARGQEMYGVFRFKQGFGGRQVTFLETYALGHKHATTALETLLGRPLLCPICHWCAGPALEGLGVKRASAGSFDFILGNRYRLLSPGRGRSAASSSPPDERLGHGVGDELLADNLHDDPAFVKRFQQEAESAAKLGHPNILRVYNVGRMPGVGTS